MDPRLQDARGRIKEAVGALLGNKDLKASGSADQAAAKATRVVRDAAKGAKGAVDKGAGAMKNAIDTATGKLTR
jgi:uncharacterized protein YjbJ (UPF0337 family)